MLKQKNSELQKHFPNKKLQKNSKFASKSSKIKNSKRKKEKKSKNKSDPFFDKIKNKKI